MTIKVHIHKFTVSGMDCLHLQGTLKHIHCWVFGFSWLLYYAVYL